MKDATVTKFRSPKVAALPKRNLLKSISEDLELKLFTVKFRNYSLVSDKSFRMLGTFLNDNVRQLIIVARSQVLLEKRSIFQNSKVLVISLQLIYFTKCLAYRYRYGPKFCNCLQVFLKRT